VYVPLLNTGTSPDRFIGASSPIAEKVEIHDETKDNGILKMEELDGVTLEPNVPISFRPGGKHLMVIGLKHPLKEGEMLPLTLQFENAGSIKVDAMVESPGAMSGERH
jgi:copper(I)-binding protein